MNVCINCLLSRRCGALIIRLGVSLWLLTSLNACQVSGQAANPLVPIATDAATLGMPAGRGAFLQGRVLGGRQPVQGAQVYVYAASAQNPQLVSEIAHTTTDHLGNFSIGPLTTTPGQGDLVYLVSNGGDAGSGYNPTAQLLSLAGTWDATTQALSYPAVTVNELTTVAIINLLGPSLAMVPCEQLDHSSKTSGICPKLLNPGDWGSVIAHSYTTGSGANTQQLADGVNDYVNLRNGTLAAKLNFASAPAASASAAVKSNYANASVLNMEASVLANCINSKGGKAQDSSACGNLIDDGTNSDTTLTAVGLLSEIVPYKAADHTGTYSSYTAYPSWGSRSGLPRLVFSPNGRYLYTNCYATVTYTTTNTSRVTSSSSGLAAAICGYAVDATTGVLTPLPNSPYQLLPAINNSQSWAVTAAMAISPNGRFLLMPYIPAKGIAAGSPVNSDHIYTIPINDDGSLLTQTAYAPANRTLPYSTYNVVKISDTSLPPTIDQYQKQQNPSSTDAQISGVGCFTLSPDGSLLLLCTNASYSNSADHMDHNDFGIIGYTLSYDNAAVTLTPANWQLSSTAPASLMPLDSDNANIKPVAIGFSQDGKTIGVTSIETVASADNRVRLHILTRDLATNGLSENGTLWDSYPDNTSIYKTSMVFLPQVQKVAVSTPTGKLSIFAFDPHGGLTTSASSTTSLPAQSSVLGLILLPNSQTLYGWGTSNIANQSQLAEFSLDRQQGTTSLLRAALLPYVANSSLITAVVSPNGRLVVAATVAGQTTALHSFIVNAGTPSNSVAALASALLAANHDQSGNLAAQHLYGHMPTHNAVYTPLPTAKPNSIQLTPVQQ
jgi:hypothetical protein